MHIDLNSCFAIIEQQANRLLRGRPVGVAAYDTPRGLVLAASYEAKRHGVKLGVSVGEARKLCRDIVIMTPDPPKYREAHRRFREVLLGYTSDVHPKSIDEFVLHLGGSPALRAGKTMTAIGYEIKEKIKERLGEAVTVNVGIGPNRFLAKLAAGLHKPDGLDTITAENLEATYRTLELLGLPGINVRYQARLEQAGIRTVLDFLHADVDYLHHRVFKSIVGYYWYLRLRGWEIDAMPTRQRSIGHQYALSHKTADRDELARLLLKMCEKVGRRLRKDSLYATGVALYMGFVSRSGRWGSHGTAPDGHPTRWAHSMKTAARLYSTKSIFQAALRLLGQAEIYDRVALLAVTVFNLTPCDPEQLELFGAERAFAATRRLSDALDQVNDRYGEFAVIPATMARMDGTIIDRIAFGNVRDMY
jgi:DNA polymerase-4